MAAVWSPASPGGAARRAMGSIEEADVRPTRFPPGWHGARLRLGLLVHRARRIGPAPPVPRPECRHHGERAAERRS